MKGIYERIIAEGDGFRENYRDGFAALIKRLEAQGMDARESFMPAEGFPEKIEQYRAEYHRMLGLDRLSVDGLPSCRLEKLGDDGNADIYRLVTPITPELWQYGLLMVPHGAEKAPLVIAQHGGGGTPELCSDMNGQNNYNHMVRRFLAREAVVFTPQLLLWNFGDPLPTQPSHRINYNRNEIDGNLKRFGMSITAVEIRGIMNAVTFLSTLDFVDGEKICMTGISYGGYFTLHTMAADTRIKAGFSNACFNDRNAYPWLNWIYRDSANMFHDAEIAALCAPRKLYIAVGKNDGVFDYKTAIPEAERIYKYYAAFGCGDNLKFLAWDGGHTMPDDDDGIDFMLDAFKN